MVSNFASYWCLSYYDVVLVVMKSAQPFIFDLNMNGFNICD